MYFGGPGCNCDFCEAKGIDSYCHFEGKMMCMNCFNERINNSNISKKMLKILVVGFIFALQLFLD